MVRKDSKQIDRYKDTDTDRYKKGKEDAYNVVIINFKNTKERARKKARQVHWIDTM